MNRLLLPALIIGTALGIAAMQPRMLSLGNLVNVLQQSSFLLVFASAQMVVILTRGFDLSLGTCVSTVSVAAALVMTGLSADGSNPVWLVVGAGILAGLGVGLLVGLFNGIFISWLGVNPFLVTLGSLNICLGIATTISGGRPVFNVPDPFSALLCNATVAGIPMPVILAGAICIILQVVLTRTVFGRALYLIGSNPRAARLGGVPCRRYLATAYVVCSMLTAFGALMLTARTGSGEPNLGGSLMLESIAAAVIGGVSLQGGVGGVPSLMFGALFVTMLSNGMDLLQMDGYVQQIILGGIIVGAIFLDRLQAVRR